MMQSKFVIGINHFIALAIALWCSIQPSNAQTQPSIGLSSLPSATDSICVIPVYTGNFNNTGFQSGDTVPDFTLYDINGDAFQLSNELSSGVPVLLISSSLTCPVFRGKIPLINQMDSIYGGLVKIIVVYTVEAHPEIDISPYSGNVWTTGQNFSQNILFRQPVTYGQRVQMVDTLLDLYPLNVDVLVDGPCNNWWLNYGPAPNNAYLIRSDGMVVAKHPWFNQAPLNMYCSIDSLLGYNSGMCSTFGNNGVFDFDLDVDSTEAGLPLQTLPIHATLTNLSTTDNVVMDIIKRQVNVPAGWQTALCSDICYASNVDSVRITLPPSTSQPFTFYFYTDAVPGQGMTRVLFRNANNPNNRFFQGFYGYTNQTGVEEDLISSPLIYPNPAQESISVGAATFTQLPMAYEIITAQGKEIESGFCNGTVSVKNYPNGLYILKLSFGGRIHHLTFAVQR
jgi:hypothetical protein